MKRLLCIIACLLPALGVQAGLRGYIAAEALAFHEDPKDPRQHNLYGSLTIEPEYFTQWNKRHDLFTFKRDGPVLKNVATAGRWLMMIAFGAMFGSTVMARLSLFIERMYFLLGDWLQIVD